ncbi:hypothetical protein KL935_004078 [Ogataea polymorpha]|nr:hypothetical protein KL908_004200 [Ogataea polymorpha]KAG7899070.1 hypothetical protein KL935_004078 [Ogataea polymorpha]
MTKRKIEDSLEADTERKKISTRDKSLYLDTINRKVLDFDYEKVCCVSLSSTNIYGCLVCNKYFRGRSMDSECFLHSINDDHHVFVNFDTLSFHILPENYQLDEQTASSLNDIRQQINPTYKDLKDIYQDTSLKRDLAGREYRPGFIGLSNFGANDYSNVILQALAHVPPLRDYLLLYPEKLHKTKLVGKLSLLVRKMYSPNLFKSHLSAHELMQFVSSSTNKRFSLHHESEPKDFLMWLLNNMHKELVLELQNNMISSIFQGKVELPSGKSKFWMLTLTLPSVTLFKDGAKLEIPQVALEDLLAAKKYKIAKAPQFLTFYIKRKDDTQKIAGVNGSNINPTVVKFNPSQLKVDTHVYKLIANVVYSSGQNENYSLEREDQAHYKIHVLDEVRNEWLEIDDLKVKPIEKDLLFLNQTYLQFWQKIA